MTKEVVVAALGDKHPGVRKNAVQLAERFLVPRPGHQRRQPSEGAEALILSALEKRVDDPDLQVQLQLAYTLGEIAAPAADDALGRLARNVDDRFLVAAVMSSINARNVGTVLGHLLENRGGGTSGKLLLTEVARVASLLNENAAQEALAAILERYSREPGKEPGNFERAAWAVGSLTGLDALTAELQKSREVERMILLQKLRALFEEARRIVVDGNTTDSARLAAVALLARGSSDQGTEDRALLAGLLAPQYPPALRAAAIAALGEIRAAETPAILLGEWRSYSSQLRGQALDLLLNRQEWRTSLVDAVERKTLSAVEFDAARRQRLLGGLKGSDRDRAEKLLAGAVNADRQKVIEAYWNVLSLEGSIERGATLFAKTCGNCHKLRMAGHEVGPDLGSVKDKSAEAMLIAMLDPNRAVESRYLSYVALTKDGRSFTGIIATESASGLTLRGPEAKEQTILRWDLEDLVGTTKSLMPEGLEKDLKPQDVADVIAFVRSNVPLPAPKEFPGNKPALVTADADGVLKALPKAAEIYGKRVVLEEKYENLGWWESEDDRAVWTLDVPAAGKYRVDLTFACNRGMGGTLAIVAGAKPLLFAVPATASWDDYVTKAAGEIELSAGRRRLELRSEGPIRGALIDLKGVTLSPVEK